jgi:general secretion pathway protein D
MMPQWSNIASYTPGNALILLGRADNLARIMTVIQEVDKATDSGIQMIPLHHASAPQIAQVLNNLQASARASGDVPGVSIAVDDRSNSVLLSGPRAMRLRMRVLIAQLDTPAASPAGNTEVVYLRYLEAKSLAPLLSKIAQSIVGKDAGASQDLSNGLNSSSTSGSKDTSSNQTIIQAEPNTNAIIITAQPALMQALKAVIMKLDIRPAQVLVEAVIAEIDEANLTSLGIQWGSVASSGQVQTSPTNPTEFPSLGAGVVGIIPGTDIQAILSVLQNQNGVDILSTPSVMVLDNQKASIEVGKDVPMQSGSYTTTAGTSTVSPFTTVDQKPVTLKLEVTPQINLSNSVRLKLNLKNDTLQNPQNPGLTPIVNTSKISNTVIINNDDVLVLGGLISTSNIENINKVPILGDLPIIGPVFQQKSQSQEKKNLMLFIKPVIMHDNDDATLISQVRYTDVRQTQANFRDELADIGRKPLTTILPPWKNKRDLPAPFATDKPQ